MTQPKNKPRLPETYLSPVLPGWASKLLKDAAQKGEPASLERRLAIERATARIKRKCPEYFGIHKTND